jgi:hypothetical protein
LANRGLCSLLLSHPLWDVVWEHSTLWFHTPSWAPTAPTICSSCVSGKRHLWRLFERREDVFRTSLIATIADLNRLQWFTVIQLSVPFLFDVMKRVRTPTKLVSRRVVDDKSTPSETDVLKRSPVHNLAHLYGFKMQERSGYTRI